MAAMKIYLKGKGVDVKARVCGSLGMMRGLMFRSKNTGNLLFEYSGKIHSWFVFFDFLAVFLDDKNKVLETKVVKPFTAYFGSEKPYSKILEIPLNTNTQKLAKMLVGGRKV